MEWENQPPQQAEDPSGGCGVGVGVGGGIFVRVMTDEQMEVLRKQIAVYASICEQLIELHKSLTSQHDLTGMRLGNLYCDPLMSSGHKITSRQRWTPTPNQLQILENMFDQGIGTPSKQKVKEITSELSQHGQISERNVYNWFQNRRARSKRKQQSTPANNAESEVETEVESPNDKKTKPGVFQPQQVLAEDLCFQNSQACSAVHTVDPRSSKPEPMLPAEGSSKFSTNFEQMSYYGSMLSNSRLEEFVGKIDVLGNYNPYLQQEDHNMDG